MNKRGIEDVPANEAFVSAATTTTTTTEKTSHDVKLE
jgi:hypothetical protein